MTKFIPLLAALLVSILISACGGSSSGSDPSPAENLSLRLQLPDSLTGPIARGDAGTIEKHVGELAERRPELLNAYREMALRTIPIAQEKGRLDLEGADKLRRTLPNELVREGQV